MKAVRMVASTLEAIPDEYRHGDLYSRPVHLLRVLVCGRPNRTGQRLHRGPPG